MSNPVELAYYRTLGIRKEFTDPNAIAQAAAIALLVTRAKVHIVTHHSILEGYPLPENGPAILTGNHHKKADSFKGLQHAIDTAGRLIRPVVKKSLMEKGAIESMAYLESITAQTESLGEYNPANAFVLKHTGAIGILRDNPGNRFVREVNKGLGDQQLMAIYLQPTRNDDCILRNLEPGAAYFAIRHPNVFVFPVAFSGSLKEPDRAVFMEPFTYAQKVKESGREISKGELTVIIADSIVTGLPKSSREDWQTRRAIELARLTTSRK